MSLEMLGGERIPPPLPPAPRSQSKKEKEREKTNSALGSQQAEGGWGDLPGPGRARGAGEDGAVGGTAPPRAAGAGGGGSGEAEGTGCSLLRPAPSARCPGWKFSEFLPQDSSGMSVCVLGEGAAGLGGSAHL